MGKFPVHRQASSIDFLFSFMSVHAVVSAGLTLQHLCTCVYTGKTLIYIQLKSKFLKERTAVASTGEVAQSDGICLVYARSWVQFPRMQRKNIIKEVLELVPEVKGNRNVLSRGKI